MKDIFKFDLSPEIITSLIVMAILVSFSFVIFLIARRADPLRKPKGLLLVAEMGVSTFDNLVKETMGDKFKGFGGYIFALAIYLFTAFIFGLTGLPSPMTYLAVPLSLGLVTFVMIHVTAIRFNKWKYFKRYISPFAVFLPVNLLSMWSPLLSLSLRLFGNALSGWVLMSLLYWALESLSAVVFSFAGEAGQIIIAPFITPVLHLYFDLFSGFVQTLVFIMLTMLFISQEQPDDELEKAVDLSVK